MGRPSTIELSKHRDAILNDLGAGKPLAVIARTYEVSPDALARFKSTRQIQILDDDLGEEEFSASSVAERLRELVEDARRLRKLASYATPGTRSRLIDSEARLLNQLRDLLGINAVMVTDQLQAMTSLLRLLFRFAKAEPEHAKALADVLAQDPDLADLGEQLKARIPTHQETA